MLAKREKSALTPSGFVRDPFSLLREITGEFDRLFGAPTGWRLPRVRNHELGELPDWTPQIDMFEKDNRLVTRVDLPGIKKDDVKVDVSDGYLTISGERKRETEEKKDRLYRTEREYGSFYRAIALPDGIKPEDVKASFAEGVLEVSVPLPARAEQQPRRVQIEDAPSAAKPAA
jgi:HSP20 family protein